MSGDQEDCGSGCDGNCTECSEKPKEHSDHMQRLKELLFGGEKKNEEKKYEPLLSVSAEMKTQWDALDTRIEELEVMKKAWIAKAKKVRLEKELWWSNLREQMIPKDAERDTLKYEDGFIFGSIDEDGDDKPNS